MTLNLRKEANAKTSNTQMKADFMQKNKITVNQPSQSHFSVEGVQTYSPVEILALKSRNQKSMNLTDGQFVKLKAYQIDGEIQFMDRPTTANQPSLKMLKSKNKKQQILQAKPKQSSKTIKPSVRNELGRANQKLLKLNKNVEKKQNYEMRLEQLSKKYKEHFGDDGKDKKKTKSKSKVQEVEDGDGNDENSLQMEEDEGEQCMPQFKEQKSIKTMAKTNKHPKEEDNQNDDSFEQVEWDKPKSIRSSRLNASTYSEKLGNAVNSLFD